MSAIVESADVENHELDELIEQLGEISEEMLQLETATLAGEYNRHQAHWLYR